MSSSSPNNNNGGHGSRGDSAPSPSLSEYLAGLLKDKRQLMAFPGVFHHLDRILEDEIASVRSKFFQAPAGPSQPLELPTPDGEKVSLQEKMFVPTQDHPDFNFIGRILGPRGMTLKKLEQETGCKIMIRGKGSTRDKRREDINRGKPNWEHLTEELHVLVSVEDTENRAQPKLDRAVEEVKKLLVPSQDNGDDELKKRQLMELAIINGTYRDTAANKVNEQPNQNLNILELMQAAAGGIPQHAPPGLNIPQHMFLPPGMQLQAGSGTVAMPPTTIHQAMHSMPPPLLQHADLQNSIMYAQAYGDFNPAALGIDPAALGMVQHQPHRHKKYQGHRSGPY